MSAVAELDLTPLARECGIPLASYHLAHVQRCVERALTRTGSLSPSELTERLRRDPRARAAFRRSVLVSVTSMFRDQEEFEILERTVIPALLAERAQLRVWSAGCARGDELRSVAEVLDRAGALDGAYLLGSDILDEALEAAVEREVLDPVTTSVLNYERRDLIDEPAPVGRFDLILCRNVAIYLERDAQCALRAKLAAALRPGGHLMLGRSETLIRPASLDLEPVSRHIFRRRRA